MSKQRYVTFDDKDIVWGMGDSPEEAAAEAEKELSYFPENTAEGLVTMKCSEAMYQFAGLVGGEDLAPLRIERDEVFMSYRGEGCD